MFCFRFGPGKSDATGGSRPEWPEGGPVEGWGMSCFFQVSKQKLKNTVKGALWKSAAKLLKANMLKAKKAKNDEKKRR